MRTKLLAILLLCSVCLYSENYTRVYSPSSGDSISMNDLFAEFDEVSRILNGFLEASNFEDGTLENGDIKDDTIETGKIKDSTLLASDFENLGSIVKGSLVYSSSLNSFGDIAIGANTKALYTDGTRLTYESMPDLPWTDTTALLHPASNDDNVVIGGTSSGTSSKAGLSLYNGTIPSTSPANAVQMYAQDVTDTNMKLLLHLDGVDGSTTFTDASYRGQTVAVLNGTAQIDTAQSKFGVASLVLDGASSIRVTSNESDFDFGSNAFTMECFVRWGTLPASTVAHCIFSKRTDTNNYMQLYVYNNAGTYTLYWTVYSGGSSILNASGTITPSINTWYHVSLSRSGTSWELYFNGTRVGSATDSDNIPDFTGDFRIGILGTAANFFSGWIDEIRVKNGERMYTGATITPPTVAFQDGVVSELKVRDEAGNVTTKSPHNFKLIPQERLKKYYFPFNYYSYNEEIGYEVSVDMYGFLKEVEKLTGKKMIFKKGVNQDVPEED